MMINRHDLINSAIEADIEQTLVQAEMGHKFRGKHVYHMHYNHVESVANLLGLDKENLRKAVRHYGFIAMNS